MYRLLLKKICKSALCLILVACTSPYKQPEIAPADALFPGLATIINSLPENSTLDVLSVHGMCSHDRKWVIEAGTQFSKHLGLHYAMPDEPLREVNGIEIWLNKLTDDSNQLVVSNYALVWSGLTRGSKQALCVDNSVASPSCPQPGFNGKRAKLNEELKSGLFNDCLSDAIIYLGDQGAIIREAMEAAIIEVGRLRGTQPRPLVIISESLGSKLVADSVLPTTDAAHSQALQSLGGTRMIFMAANQIPLLDLAQPEKKKLDQQGTSIQTLRRTLQTLSVMDIEDGAVKRDRAIYLIAFSDPNDLLSYELREPVDRTTVNVRVSNSPTWLGLFENPEAAHTGYLERDEIWRLINCGVPDACD